MSSPPTQNFLGDRPPCPPPWITPVHMVVQLCDRQTDSKRFYTIAVFLILCAAASAASLVSSIVMLQSYTQGVSIKCSPPKTFWNILTLVKFFT